MAALSDDIIAKLGRFTACDVSDALLKLKVPGAGFIADLNPYCLPNGDGSAKTIAPVSTVMFVAKGEVLEEPSSNIPGEVHWADLSQSGTVVVLKQPPGQTNAVCGGIMAMRMSVLEVKGIITAGRVRDLDELKATGLPVRRYHDINSDPSYPAMLNASRFGLVAFPLLVSVVGAPHGLFRFRSRLTASPSPRATLHSSTPRMVL
jgi:regulator of RNase E activity RraA